MKWDEHEPPARPDATVLLRAAAGAKPRCSIEELLRDAVHCDTGRPRVWSRVTICPHIQFVCALGFGAFFAVIWVRVTSGAWGSVSIGFWGASIEVFCGGI